MPEVIWIAKIIKLKEKGDWNKVLFDFIRPIIEKAENEELLDTFHFFFEPELHFRICPKKPEMVDRVEEIISQNAEGMRDMIEIKSASYPGEQPDYGVKGWRCAQKFFEFGSRFSLLKLETLSKLAEAEPEKHEEILKSCRLDKNFNENKLVHCFLNQTGRGYDEEALFHQQKTIQSMLNYVRALYNRLEERLKKVEEQLKNK